MKNRPEIDSVLRAVCESHGKRVLTHHLEMRDPMDGMHMAGLLPQWLDLDGRLAGWQELPIVVQFIPVNLCPCFDQPLLSLREAAAQTFDCVDSEYRGLILVVRVEVCAMVRAASLNEHPNHDSENLAISGIDDPCVCPNVIGGANVCVSAAAAHCRACRRRLQMIVRRPVPMLALC